MGIMGGKRAQQHVWKRLSLWRRDPSWAALAVQDLETLLDLKREIRDSEPNQGFFLHVLPES